MTRDTKAVQLASSWSNNLLQSTFAFLVLALGGALSVLGQKTGWLICIVSGAVIVLLIFRHISRSSTLVLMPGGFSLTQADIISSFKWSDVETFYVSGAFFARVVSFSLSASGEQRLEPLSKFTNPRDHNARTRRKLPDDYGLGVEGLKLLMSEWKQQFARR